MKNKLTVGAGIVLAAVVVGLIISGKVLNKRGEIEVEDKKTSIEVYDLHAAMDRNQEEHDENIDGNLKKNTSEITEDKTAEGCTETKEIEAAENQEKTSEEKAVENPGKASGEKAVENPGKTSGEKAVENPGKTSGEKAVENPGKTSGEKAVENPGKVSGEKTVENQIKTKEEPISGNGNKNEVENTVERTSEARVKTVEETTESASKTLEAETTGNTSSGDPSKGKEAKKTEHTHNYKLVRELVGSSTKSEVEVSMKCAECGVDKSEHNELGESCSGGHWIGYDRPTGRKIITKKYLYYKECECGKTDMTASYEADEVDYK